MAMFRPRFIRKETYTKAKAPIIVALAWIGILAALAATVGFVWLGWWDIPRTGGS